MYNLELSDLTPGRKYRVSVSATRDGYRESEISPVFEFTTSQDVVAPAKVGNLTLVSEGDSFVANWEKPVVNSDGTNCNDFSHYIVSVADMTSPTGLSKQFTTSQNTYTLTFDMNAEMFGKPKGMIGVRVQAVDSVGNIGEFSDVVAQNPVPQKVEGLAAKSALEAIDLSWKLNNETDIAGYEIHMGQNINFTTSSGSKIGEVSHGTDKFLFSSFSFESIYLKVVAKDKFGQKSIDSDVISAQPKLATDFDKTPPGTVRNFNVQQILSDDQSYAIAKISYTKNIEPDLDKYDVQYRKTGAVNDPWSFRNVPSDEEQAVVYPLSTGTSYDFKIRAIDFNANKGPWSNVITAPGVQKTTNPDIPTELTAMGGNTNVMLTWEGSTDSSMSNGKGTYEISYDLSEDFNDEKTLRTGSTIATVANLLANTVYYFRVRAVDPFGNKSNWTDFVETNTGIIPGSAWADPRDFTKIDGGKIYTGTIDARSIKSHTIDATQIVVGGLDAATVIKDGTIVTEKLGAQAITAEKIKSGTITGDLISANTSLINDLFVNNTMTIRDTGNIKSENYSEENNTGFYLDKQQLIINQGRIRASAIELQSGQNVMPPQYASFNHSANFYQQNVMLVSDAVLKRVTPGGMNGPYLSATPSAAPSGFRFSRSSTDFNLNLDTKSSYIVSFYAKSTSSVTVRFSLYFTGSSKYSSDIFVSGSTWKRYSAVIPASDIVSSAASAGVYIVNGNGIKIDFDWFQIEAKTSTETKPSPWSPPGVTSIDGGSITTGSISSTTSIATSNGNVPAWSIDTAGKATFADAVINGKLIVGQGETTEDGKKFSVVSSNYVTGMSGWSIMGDGNVEFNDGKFRGTLDLTKEANKLSIAVRPVKVYTTDVNYTDVNTPNIQGTTYSYKRAPVGTGDMYQPTAPDAEKSGKFFIGPTTERSVNIQVHDSNVDSAVYLADPPQNVFLSSLTVGELIDSTSAPLVRENQGLEFYTERSDSKNYSFRMGGKTASTLDRKNVTSTRLTSQTILRSPLYPESKSGEIEYPSSRHILESQSLYETPIYKNKLSSETALAAVQSFVSERSNVVGFAPNEELSESGYNVYAVRVEPWSRMTNFKVENIAGQPMSKYIFSADISTVNSTATTFVAAAAISSSTSGVLWMTPLNKINDSLIVPSVSGPSVASTYLWDFNGSWSNKTGGASSTITAWQGTLPSATGMTKFISSNGTSVQTGSLNNATWTNGGTMSFWIKPSNWSTNSGAAIIHRAPNATGTLPRELWLTDRMGYLEGGFKPGGAASWVWRTSSGTLPINKWSHVTIVIGPSVAGRQFDVYIDGKFQQLSTISGSNTDTGTFLNTDRFIIGSNQQKTSPWEGEIDDFQLWNVPLSPSDIRAVYELPRTNGLETVTPPLTSYTSVEPTKRQRIAFHLDYEDTRYVNEIRLFFLSDSVEPFYLNRFQLEEAIYIGDTTLPAEIRDSNNPTPWSVNGVKSDSQVSLRLEARPMVNPYDFIQSVDQKMRGLLPRPVKNYKKTSPSDLVIEFSSSYMLPGTQKQDVSTSGEFRFSPSGLNYPGSVVPYMPTAAAIEYQYLSNNRPRVGGGSGWQRTNIVGNSSFGEINISDQSTLIENFNYPNRVSLPPGWSQSGSNGSIEVYNSKIRMFNANWSPSAKGQAIYYSMQALATSEQTVEFDSQYNSSGGGYSFIGGPVVSLDPETDDCIFIHYDAYLKNYTLNMKKGGVVTELRSGTVPGTSDAKLSLKRTGNTIRFSYNGNSVFNLNFDNLPTGGRYVGFVIQRGCLDNFYAYEGASSGVPIAFLNPNSVNVNNGRGLSVSKSNYIDIGTSGFYALTLDVAAVTQTAFGNGIGDAFELKVQDSEGSVHWLSPTISGEYIYKMHGSATVYLPPGSVTAWIETNDSTATFVEWARFSIVRVS